MAHAYAELVRPDNITRSGIIQPFNVVSQSPVRFARDEIQPFIQAIRPQGSMYRQGGVTLQGGLPNAQLTFEGGPFGIVSPEVIRTLGQEEPTMSPWWYAGAALVLGLAGGFVMAKAL